LKGAIFRKTLPVGQEFEKTGGLRGVSENEREHRQVRGAEQEHSKTPSGFESRPQRVWHKRTHRRVCAAAHHVPGVPDAEPVFSRWMGQADSVRRSPGDRVRGGRESGFWG